MEGLQEPVQYEGQSAFGETLLKSQVTTGGYVTEKTVLVDGAQHLEL